ncbi:MAG TPA: 4-hydroxyacetophenone monooxygenase, partial [Alcanivorax sp.]|nr:4-hydroxyacetophenone monooxygenase [Alcanivorax sp.]
MNSRAKVYQYARPVKVAIVGGGFGGLCMAIKLREAGIEDFVLLEKAEQVGGTWRDNSYPGCACDVQSHMYSFSFEGNPDWSARYSGWKEIQDYILRTTEKHGIQEKTRFNAEVCGAHFDQDKALWTLDLKDGSQVVCQHWVLASGPLHVPQIPNFPGLDRFKGKVFHSSQWDHDYDLTGKKVVSVGTGASAIQYVPQIAPEV